MSSAFNQGAGSMNTYMEGEAQYHTLKRNAMMALQEGEAAEEASRLKNNQISSRQKTLYAKAGVDISSGSPLLVMTDTASEAQLEAERIRWGKLEEYRMLRHYARMAKTAGNAGSTQQAIGSGIEVAKMVVGAFAGAAAGGGAGGAIKGAISGGESVSGEQWGKFINSFSNRGSGLGKMKSPYSGGYY